MIKIMHGRTNYRKLQDKCLDSSKQFQYMGDILRIDPLDDYYWEFPCCYRLTFKNDVIDFYLDDDDEIAVPIAMQNIIEDIDITTFVTESSIVKKHQMRMADERLYNICKGYIFIVGREII